MSPNPLNNCLRFAGRQSDIDQLLQFIKSTPAELQSGYEECCTEHINFQRILPCPALEEFEYRSCEGRSIWTAWAYRLMDIINEYYYPASKRLFDWQMEHWGSYNSFDSSRDGNDIYFLTHEPILPTFYRLSKRFPTVAITYEYYRVEMMPHEPVGYSCILENGVQCGRAEYWPEDEGSQSLEDLKTRLRVEVYIEEDEADSEAADESDGDVEINHPHRSANEIRARNSDITAG